MRIILSILGIIFAGAIFFMYTKPTYDVIQTMQAQVAQYNTALDKATQLQQLKQTLLSRYNSFNASDLARLQTLLPDQVNNIGLILDLDTLAAKDSMSLENVNISSSDSSGSGSSSSAVSTIGASTGPYQSLNVQFTVHGTYAQFIRYITNLESSLRIVDLVHVSVAGSGSGGSIYTFDVTLRTYWLK